MTFATFISFTKTHGERKHRWECPVCREDAHEDFVLLQYKFAGQVDGHSTWDLDFTASSAKHTEEIFRLLGCTGEHRDCQRVESVLDLPNVIRADRYSEMIRKDQ